MKKFAALLAFAIAALSPLFFVQAQETPQAPLTVELTSEAGEFSASDQIPLTATIQNHSSSVITDIELALDLPQGFAPENQENKKAIDLLKSGETQELSWLLNFTQPMMALNKLQTIPESAAAATIDRNITFNSYFLLAVGGALLLVAGFGIIRTMKKRRVRKHRFTGYLLIGGLILSFALPAAPALAMENPNSTPTTGSQSVLIKVDGVEFEVQVNLSFAFGQQENIDSLLGQIPNRNGENVPTLTTAVPRETASLTKATTEPAADGSTTTSETPASPADGSADGAAGVPNSPAVIPDYFYHTVSAGETFYSIAIHYDLTIYELAAYNGKSLDSLNAGEQLKIPASYAALQEAERLAAEQFSTDPVGEASTETLAPTTTLEATEAPTTTTTETPTTTTTTEEATTTTEEPTTTTTEAPTTTTEAPTTTTTTEAPTTTSEAPSESDVTTDPSATDDSSSAPTDAEVTTTTTAAPTTTTAAPTTTTAAPTTTTTAAPTTTTTAPPTTTTTTAPPTTTTAAPTTTPTPTTPAPVVSGRSAKIANWYANNYGLIGSKTPAGYDASSYTWGACTWYAYNARAAIGEPVERYLGGAGTWGLRTSLPVHNDPRVGSVGWSQYGYHVFFVEEVYADGSILISEGGWNYTNGNYNQRYLRASSVGSYRYID